MEQAWFHSLLTAKADEPLQQGRNRPWRLTRVTLSLASWSRRYKPDGGKMCTRRCLGRLVAMPHKDCDPACARCADVIDTTCGLTPPLQGLPPTLTCPKRCSTKSTRVLHTRCLKQGLRD